MGRGRAERIFKPLEIARTVDQRHARLGDFSYPYLVFGGGIGRVPFRNIDAGPAGSINSSVEEMLHYVQMHLSLGEWNGKRILSAERSQIRVRRRW
jgi:CubicO group peptidase (beta-lactamase class C family)